MQTWWKQHLTSPVINFLGRHKASRYFDRPPILIGGCARSGTSLLLSMLSAHPSVFCFPHEVDAFTRWRKSSSGYVPERLDRLYRSLLMLRIPSTAHRWCEKRPYNVHFIGQILEYFGEEARFIHLVRDPRDVCTSRHPERPGEYWVDPHRWVRDVGAGLQWKDHSSVLTVKFEDLLARNAEELSRICSFLDEPVCEEVLNWHEHAAVRHNRAWFGPLRPLDTKVAGRWRDPEHRQRVQKVVAQPGVSPLMKELRYTG